MFISHHYYLTEYDASNAKIKTTSVSIRFPNKSVVLSPIGIKELLFCLSVLIFMIKILPLNFHRFLKAPQI